MKTEEDDEEDESKMNFLNRRKNRDTESDDSEEEKKPSFMESINKFKSPCI
jgi:hypothetical protein